MALPKDHGNRDLNFKEEAIDLVNAAGHPFYSQIRVGVFQKAKIPRNCFLSRGNGVTVTKM